MNNRETDIRSQEKDKFDGQSVEGQQGTTSAEAAPQQEKKKPRRRTAQVKPEDKHVDETAIHKLTDYHNLPEGAHYVTRNGKIDIHYFEYIEYLPAKVVRHIYEVARVADGDTIVSSLPDEVKEKAAAKGCPFDARLMAFILCEKYAYHSSINTIKKKLRDMGAIFSKTTLNHYFHAGTDALMGCFDETYHTEVLKSVYLMIDETCELVAVEDEETASIKYKKKYLWAFFDKAKKLVHYIFEKGSRGMSVVENYLQGWQGSISTDGYVAYRAFSDKHPDILHIGCWVHARRLFIESLVSDRKNSLPMIEDCAEMFGIEYNCKLQNMTDEERKRERRKKSRPILARMLIRAIRLSKNAVVMANATMAKAINYLLNQWGNLRNFILDGRVEISNNLVEQRMKTIKLDMKNCQNIGSEAAAKRHAFMHSLIESCSLNEIQPVEYLTNLFGRYKTLKDEEKVALLPCYYKK